MTYIQIWCNWRVHWLAGKCLNYTTTTYRQLENKPEDPSQHPLIFRLCYQSLKHFLKIYNNLVQGTTISPPLSSPKIQNPHQRSLKPFEMGFLLSSGASILFLNHPFLFFHIELKSGLLVLVLIERRRKLLLNGNIIR